MGIYVLLLLVFLAGGQYTEASTCGIDEYRCCFTEFLVLVNNSTGIQLTEEKIEKACKIYDPTMQCLEDFESTCNETVSQDFWEHMNKTRLFLMTMCSMESDFNMDVKAAERCFLDSSEKFLNCTRRYTFPVQDSDDTWPWKTECCEYMYLRNCAVESVEECGSSAKETLHVQIMAINGAGLEFACPSVYSQCRSSSTSLASTLFVLLICAATFVFRHSYL